ncbi:MAG: [NiFe] hydrogenase metallocenter assembly protein HypD, partial [uncultured Solirubrobacterales bacterium]
DPAPARRGPPRGREPVRAGRPLRRQHARARGALRGLRAAPALRVARPRLHLPERAQVVARLRGLRCGGALRRAGSARGRPQGVPVRRGPEGRDQAVGVQGLRHRVHARAPDRHVHGLAGGRVRGLLQLRSLRARARGGV